MFRIQARQGSCVIALVALAGVIGCAASRDPVDEGGGSDSGGPTPLGSQTPLPPARATSIATAAAMQCGGSCSADLAAGRAALAAGDVEAAAVAYACADTAEAAFGAGLSTTLAAFSGARTDQLLKDLGQPPLDAREVIGPDGLLARHAARWNGSGSFTFQGGQSGQFGLSRALAQAGGPGDGDPFGGDRDGISGFGVDTRYTYELDIYDYAGAAPGATSVVYDCSRVGAGGTASLGPGIPRISFFLHEIATGVRTECQIPFSLDGALCEQDHGVIELSGSGRAVGQEVIVELRDLRMRCDAYDHDDDIVAPQPYEVRVSGQVRALATAEVETSDLHPLLAGAGIDPLQIEAALSLSAFAAHVTALSADFARASCFFARAAEGPSGAIEVFRVPAALVSAPADVPMRTADAQLLSGLAAGMGAVLQLGGAYDVELPLREVACLLMNDESEPRPGCTEGALHTAMLNMAFMRASVRRDRIEAGRVLLDAALSRALRAHALADAQSMLPRDAVTSAGWEVLRALTDALSRSLSEGATPLPYVMPTLAIDVRALLDGAPSPSIVSGPAFSYREDCDDWGCYTELSADSAYFSALWSPLGVDFAQQYSTGRQLDAVSDVVEALERSLSRHRVLSGASF